MDLIIKNPNTGVKKSYPVTTYKLLQEPKTLLIAFNSSMSDDGKNIPAYEVVKVQFIAAGVTDFDEAPLVFAGYIDPDGILATHIIQELPLPYEPERGYAAIFDYLGYREICELTGEQILPFNEYVKEFGLKVLNFIYQIDGKVLNEEDYDIFTRKMASRK